jgi:translation initiation factor IF-2
MAENATIRLNKVLRELNISLDRAVDYLAANGHAIEARPTTKISEEVYQVLFGPVPNGYEQESCFQGSG